MKNLIIAKFTLFALLLSGSPYSLATAEKESPPMAYSQLALGDQNDAGNKDQGDPIELAPIRHAAVRVAFTQYTVTRAADGTIKITNDVVCEVAADDTVPVYDVRGMTGSIRYKSAPIKCQIQNGPTNYTFVAFAGILIQDFKRPEKWANVSLSRTIGSLHEPIGSNRSGTTDISQKSFLTYIHQNRWDCTSGCELKPGTFYSASVEIDDIHAVE